MSTFGELRSDLLKLPIGAGTDLELLTRFVNNRIDGICRQTDYTRLDKQSTLLTVAQYTTGTISIVAGATAGTGTGTAFTAAMTGRRFRIANLRPWYTFTYVSPTSFTIDRAYEGTEDAVDVAFIIWGAIYTLPADLVQLYSIENLTLGMDLDPQDREFIDDIDPARYQMRSPEVFIPAEDSDAGLQQIELWPGPVYAEGMAINYRSRVPVFGVNDTGAEIPDWISVPALFEGVQASLYKLQGDTASANAQEAIFKMLVDDMRGEDARKRPPAVMQSDSRFVRPRIRRTLRGYGSGRRTRNWNGGEIN